MAAAVHVWLTDLRALSDAQLAPVLAWLDPGGVARAARFLREERRRQFLAARWLLAVHAARMLACRPGDLRIAEVPGSAPVLQLRDGRAAPLFFSISHSAHWVGCALSATGPIGFDLEVRNPQRDFPALAQALLPDVPEAAQMHRFYELWCSREAEIKLGSVPAAMQLMQWEELQLALAFSFSAARCEVHEASA